MSVFVNSTTAAVPHGVYGIERQVPRVIRAIGTGVAACVAQFPWGPDAELVTPESSADLVNMFMPAGCDRVNSTGCAAIVDKAFPTLKIVRVVGSTAAKASVDIPEEGSGSVGDIVAVVAKYKGLLGNSIVVTISNATDGDADKFNLKATLTGANGTTEDTVENIDFSEADAPAVTLTNTKLIGAITQIAPGRPGNGTYNLTGGVSGTVASADYIGTAGAGDEGIALLETDRNIRHVFIDDCGDSLRSATNAGLQAHAILMGDRQVYVIGNKGLSVANLKTDKLNYTSDRVLYCDPWVRVLVDGQLVDAPSAPFFACVASRIPPSLSIAWKGQPIGEMLAGIRGLVTQRGPNVLADLASNGINTLITEEDGSFRIESDNVASFVSSPDTGGLTRRRMADYIVISGARSLRPYTDAPNITELHDEEVIMLRNFLAGLKANKKVDVFNLPFIDDFQIEDVASANPTNELAANKFQLPFKVKTGSQQSWIYLLATVGPTVTITQQPS